MKYISILIASYLAFQSCNSTTEKKNETSDNPNFKIDIISECISQNTSDTTSINEVTNFEKYKQLLKKENLTPMEYLEKIIAPLIKKATKIEVSKPTKPPSDSQLISHFGGQPYFESNEEWPKSKSGNYLDFIFQVFNNGSNDLPNNIKLVQFFYDWEEFPWDTKHDGWLVKIYENIDTSQIKKIEKPIELEISKFCEIHYKPVQSLPDWTGIDIFNDEASELSYILNEEEPWASYEKVVEKLIGEQDFQSQIKGYPKWIQGESTPNKDNGEPMNLLFQIGSEDNAGIMWEDDGFIYVFYDETSKRIEFTLQCF
jgi:uncharacterized protein YwqG